MTLLQNQFSNPLFMPVLVRLVVVLASGFLIVLAFNLGHLRGLFQSETWRRYASWLLMAPAFFVSVFTGGIVGLGFVALLMATALREYWQMFNLPHFYRRVLLVGGALSLLMASAAPGWIYGLPVAYFVLVVGASIARNRVEFVFEHLSKTLFGLLWIAFPLAHFLLFRSLDGGVTVLVLLGFSVALADVLAYCTGKLFFALGLGTESFIAGRISPNKTWAGTLGNAAGALVGVSLFLPLVSSADSSVALPFALLIAAASVFGDFTESLVKRCAEVKDSSSAIPGHGGVLDRIDSLLMVVIAGYYFVQLVGWEV